MTSIPTIDLSTIPSSEQFQRANAVELDKEVQLEKARAYKRENGKSREIVELKSAKILGYKDVESNKKLPSFILKDYKKGNLRKAGYSEEQINKIKKRKIANENRTALSKGKTFERKVYNYIKEQKEKGYLQANILYGSWIEYIDKNGLGYAQPDIVVVPLKTSALFILECKLTQTDEAIPQLQRLYRPLLSCLFPERSVHTVQCFSNIVHKKNFVYNILDFFRRPQAGVWNWHYLT